MRIFALIRPIFTLMLSALLVQESAAFVLLNSAGKRPDGTTAPADFYLDQAVPAGLAEFGIRTFAAVTSIFVSKAAFAQTQAAVGIPSRFKSTFLLPVKFKAYDASTASKDTLLAHVMGTVGGLAFRLQPSVNVWQKDAVTPDAVAHHRQMQEQFLTELLRGLGAQEEFEKILGRPLSSDLSRRWDEILFDVLPHYFGNRGFYWDVSHDSLVKEQPSSLAYPELSLTVGLYPVLSVRRVQVSEWNGQTSNWQKIEIDKPVVLNGLPIETARTQTRALADDLTIITHRLLMVAAAKIPFDEIAMAKSSLDQVENKEWEDVAGTLNPIDFAKFKALAHLRRNSPSVAEMQRMEAATEDAHEVGHFADAKMGRLPLRIPWPQTWPAYQTGIVDPTITSELECMMREMRFAPPQFLDVMITRLLTQWQVAPNGLNYQTARFNLIHLFLQEIVAQPNQYPSIRWKGRTLRYPRTHATGQLYRITYDEWTRAWDAVHEKWDKAGRPLYRPKGFTPDDLFSFGGEVLPVGAPSVGLPTGAPAPTQTPPAVFGAASTGAVAALVGGTVVYRTWAKRRLVRKKAEIAYLTTEVGTKAKTLHSVLNNKAEFERVLGSGKSVKSYRALRDGALKAGDAAMGVSAPRYSLIQRLLLSAASAVALASIGLLLSYWLGIDLPLWHWKLSSVTLPHLGSKHPEVQMAGAGWSSVLYLLARLHIFTKQSAKNIRFSTSA